MWQFDVHGMTNGESHTITLDGHDSDDATTALNVAATAPKTDWIVEIVTPTGLAVGALEVSATDRDDALREASKQLRK